MLSSISVLFLRQGPVFGHKGSLGDHLAGEVQAENDLLSLPKEETSGGTR